MPIGSDTARTSPRPGAGAADVDLAGAAHAGFPAVANVAEVRAQLALAAGDMATFEWDIAGKLVHCDPGLAELFGLPGGQRSYPIDLFFAAIHPEDVPAIDAAITRSIQQDVDYHMEWRVCHPRRGVRWIGGRGRITERDAQGAALRMLGVNWDITERKAQEQALSTLAMEMEHRVKNAFAMVSALTGIAARRATSIEDMVTTLRAQIAALGSAHALATGEARGQVALVELITTALTPWANSGLRVEVDPALLISTQAASGLAMLLYELTTNAAKYGGLSGQGAQLSVVVTKREDGGAQMIWRETLPHRTERLHDTIGSDGFGSILLAQAARALDAELSRDLRPDGLNLTLTIPAHGLAVRSAKAGQEAAPARPARGAAQAQ